jgi:cholesterol oxidase
MNERYDAVVVGSGFGGAVSALRLAEHGYRVLVLERGRRWDAESYPRAPGDAWLWDQAHPEHRNGWIDVRVFPRMTVAAGAGVGGGSLVYANVLLEAKEELLQHGWPAEITFDELRPYYATVGQMLGANPVPESQISERTRIMREGATAIGRADRFQLVPVAVTFDPEWSYDRADPFDQGHSRSWTNQWGVQQGTCVHCGDCDIGCEVHAKNTLDLNYIAAAEQHGAEVRPLHLVRRVVAEDGGYRVEFDRLADGRRHPGSVSARIVVVSAGTLGTNEIMLRSRDEGTLPALSPRLGKGWSSNGDFVTGGWYPHRAVGPARGPTISASLDFLDGSEGERFYIEDGGVPELFVNAVEAASKGSPWRPRSRAIRETARELMRRGDPLEHLMPWFAQGVDASDGAFRMRRRWFGLFGPKQLRLDWQPQSGEPVIDAIVSMHERLSAATDGEAIVPPTWTLAKYLATPHPLGGCHMAARPEDGVVSHLGEVFGHRNLFIADGSIVPRAIGLNPAKTIAALAERIAGEIVEERR